MSERKIVNTFPLSSEIIQIVDELSSNNYGFDKITDRSSEVWKIGDLPNKKEAGKIICGRLDLEEDWSVFLRTYDSKYRDELRDLIGDYLVI